VYVSKDSLKTLPLIVDNVISNVRIAWSQEKQIVACVSKIGPNNQIYVNVRMDSTKIVHQHVEFVIYHVKLAHPTGN
jgi:hypothetical protein